MFAEAAETEEDLRFGSASQLLETLTASVETNGTRGGKQAKGHAPKPASTPAPLKKTPVKTTAAPRRVTRHASTAARKQPAMASSPLVNPNQGQGSSGLTDLLPLTAFSEVER